MSASSFTHLTNVNRSPLKMNVVVVFVVVVDVVVVVVVVVDVVVDIDVFIQCKSHFKITV